MARAAIRANAYLDLSVLPTVGLVGACYVLVRVAGKWLGAFLGSRVVNAHPNVQKYLGFTLLPHSGISLIFTGIAVSVLEGTSPEGASIIQGTIAAAAVINEVIAVYMAKKGFEWAGELQEGGRSGKGRKRKAGGAV